jgi:hypothetical protein
MGWRGDWQKWSWYAVLLLDKNHKMWKQRKLVKC